MRLDIYDLSLLRQLTSNASNHIVFFITIVQCYFRVLLNCSVTHIYFKSWKEQFVKYCTMCHITIDDTVPGRLQEHVCDVGQRKQRAGRDHGEFDQFQSTCTTTLSKKVGLQKKWKTENKNKDRMKIFKTYTWSKIVQKHISNVKTEILDFIN